MKRSVTKKPKLTKWFDGSVKPVRDGVYQRKYNDWSVYCKFKNGNWYCAKADAYFAQFTETISDFQNDPWRGLAQNQEVQP